MPSEKLYSEIIEEFKKETTKEGRLEVLRKYTKYRFHEFLFGVFSDKVKFDVEIPQYRPSELYAGANDTYINIEFKRMYLFITGHPKRPPDLTKEKQTKLLKGILEALHKDEAALYIKMLKKDLEVPYLTKKLVKEAFPNLDI